MINNTSAATAATSYLLNRCSKGVYNSSGHILVPSTSAYRYNSSNKFKYSYNITRQQFYSSTSSSTTKATITTQNENNDNKSIFSTIKEKIMTAFKQPQPQITTTNSPVSTELNSTNNNNIKTTNSSIVEPLLPKKPIQESFIKQPQQQNIITTIEPSSESDPLLDPVVKVFSVLTSPNHYTPWQMKPQRSVTGSGFIISGKRILTNAHVVADQTLVMVTKFGNPNKFPARLISAAHEYDLAMLTVDDDTFWEGLTPLELGDLPDLQEVITVVGFPTGGSNICVTQGVVSRIDLQMYAHSETQSLSIQIDAAINPGNSGGPALKDGKVVGIAFQNIMGASSIGFIIPTPVINRFIRDIEMHGKFTGVPKLGIFLQSLETMPKKFFNLPATGVTGVVVHEMHPFSAARGIVQTQDIITHINGCPVADDGSIAFRRRERISLEYLLLNHFVGDKIELTLLRKGEKLNVQIPLVNDHSVVPFQKYDSRPSYFVYSGLVFVPITYPFLLEHSEDFAITYRKIYERADKITCPDYQVVILSQVLHDKTNHGYANFAMSEVKKVNDTPIRCLSHLVELIESSKDDYIVITLENEHLIVLDRSEAEEASERVMIQHSIPHLKSLDLRNNNIITDGKVDNNNNKTTANVIEGVVINSTCSS
ncbi:hypothetical protein CYY_007638 [Polysphondylium violaceum]|uniref:Protease Do-like PDZ domain-containing protein n=1 Tax=Polysphondylium violaceum TaxID=133409 RepID=A0A8J4UXK4_9MYCE|nr:hypothetical protein CYY_007638 [Polysphondylium violaceum]